jgi:excisionase family DNA binding protein
MSTQLNTSYQKLLNINEASSYLNLKVSKLRMMIFKREIPMVKIGRLVRFNRLELDQWIEQLSRN